MQQRGAIVRMFRHGITGLADGRTLWCARSRQPRPAAKPRARRLVPPAADPLKNLFVTHDIEESLHLADRVVMLGSSPGRIIDELRRRGARGSVRTLIRSPEFLSLRERIAEGFREETYRIEAESVVGGDAEGI